MEKKCTNYLQITFLLVTSLWAQENNVSPNQGLCGTRENPPSEMQQRPWYGNNAWLDRYRDSLSQVFSSCQNCRVEGNSENVWYRVPIEFVIPVWQGQNVLQRNQLNTDKALKALLFHLNF